MTVGERIRKLREQLGMTQQELADKVGYKTRIAISKIETNDRNVTQAMILDFAKALRTTPSYLMGWDENDMVRIRPNLIDKFKNNNNTSRKNKKMVIVTNKEKQITLALMHDLSDEEIRSINAIIETCAEQIRKRKERK